MRAEVREDQVVLLAGGVAFFVLIALVPAIVALVSIFGLVADPTEIQDQVEDSLAAAPDEVRELVQSQLESIVSSSDAGLGVGVVVGVLVALWAASSGMAKLIAAINLVYDEHEARGFLQLRGLALALTIGGILFLAAAVFLVTFLPSVMDGTGLGDATQTAVSILRWPGLALGWILGLAVLYRLAPAREDARWRWVTPGALVATVVWLLGSAAFSIYTSSFGSYNETYGALGAIVITMLWLQITAFAVLLGAEVNAEVEHQTAEDSTTGEPQPMGRRGAEMADTVGEPADAG